MFSIDLVTEDKFVINNLLDCHRDCVDSLCFFPYIPNSRSYGGRSQNYSSLLEDANTIDAFIQDIKYENAYCA